MALFENLILEPEPEQMGLIQGQMPDSIWEWWVAKALWKYKMRFEYQWEILGGRTRQGGLFVDFVIWNPMLTPLLVYGDYWHRHELDGGDKTRILAIASYFNIGWRQIPILFGNDAKSEESVMQFIKEKIVR